MDTLGRSRSCGILLVFACGDSRGPAITDECHGPRDLTPVADVLADAADPCYSWFERAHGRAVRVDAFSHGSGSIWSQRTESGVAVMTSAAHVISPCWSLLDALESEGASSPTCYPMLHDPSSLEGEALIRLAVEGGGPASSDLSAHFPPFNTSLSSEEWLSESG